MRIRTYTTYCQRKKTIQNYKANGTTTLLVFGNIYEYDILAKKDINFTAVSIYYKAKVSIKKNYKAKVTLNYRVKGYL